MTAITILKDRIPTGPFTREQVAEKLRTGECSLSDLAFVEGLAQWTPLRDVLAKLDGPAPAPSTPLSTPPPYVPERISIPPTDQTNSKMAIAAISCGFAGILCGITMIPAVILGHLALGEIKRNPALKGRGMAITSLVIGYLWITIVVVSVIIASMGAVSRAAQKNGITINSNTSSGTSVTYASTSKSTVSGSVDSLSDTPEIDHVKQKIAPADIGLNESATITIMVTENRAGSFSVTSSTFDLPAVDGLTFSSTGNSITDNVTDGKTVFSVTRSFTVQATRTGSFTIPASDIHMADGQVYHVQAMTLNVHP